MAALPGEAAEQPSFSSTRRWVPRPAPAKPRESLRLCYLLGKRLLQQASNSSPWKCEL